MSMRAAVLPALGLLLSFPGSTAAHVGAGAGQTDVLLPSTGPSRVLVPEPFGLLTSTDADTFEWVCHEILSESGGGSLLPRVVAADDGTLLAVVGQLNGVIVPGVSLYLSDDGGCSFLPASGLDGRIVGDATFLPELSEIAVAVTADLGEGASNGIHRSVDGGRAWTLVTEVPGRIHRSVKAGPAGRVYVISVTIDPPSAWLSRSDDGGETFTERALNPVGVESLLIGDVLAVDTLNPDEVWVRFDGDGSDVLLRSLDGGGSWLPPQGLPPVILDLTLLPDGGALVVGGPRAIFASEDRALFTPVESTAQVWGGAVSPELGFVAALNTLSEDDAVAASLDGGRTFSSLLRTTELAGPRVCPVGSDVERVCAPLWPTLQENLARLRPPSGDDDDSADPDPPPAACASCPDSTAAALLPLLWGPWRVRRRRQPQSTLGSSLKGLTIR